MKRIIPLFICLTMLINVLCVSVVTVGAQSSGIKDMDNHWAKEMVSKLSELGVVNGDENGNFKPEEQIAVDAFIKMAVTSAGYTVENGQEYWASTYIDKAKELGLVKDGEFNDYTRSISRGEIARIIVRALKANYSDQMDQYKTQITDYESIPDDYKDSILKAYDQKIITGYEDGSFQYDKNATRAEAAVMIVRMIDKNKQGTASGSVTAYYISNDGNDTNPGTEEAPFKTLEKARDAIRELKKANAYPESGITVYLRGGTYERLNSFELDAQDSGADKGPVVYQSYPGESARLTGGAILQKDWFAPVKDTQILNRLIEPDAKGKVLQVDLKAHGITDYGDLSRHGYHVFNMGELPPMELFIGGKVATLSRWPNDNKDDVKMGTILSAGPTAKDPDFYTTGGSFTYEYNRPELWKDTSDVWLSGIFGQSWEWSYNKLGKLDTTNKQITLGYGEYRGVLKSWFPDYHHFENILEELDMPGEYYIDRTSGILYLIPNDAFTKDEEVTVSMLKTPMINIKGTSFITFKNLLMDSGRHFAVQSTSAQYSQATAVPPKNLWDGIPEGDRGGEKVIFENCEIRDFTQGGALITGKDSGFINSRIQYVGGVGVLLQGGTFETLEPGNNFAKNCEIHDTAYYYRAYSGPLALRGVGNIASHNHIYNTPHGAIYVFGNDHLIEYNDIHDVTTDYSDLGAIYANASERYYERGTVIRNNYFHNIALVRPHVFAIYPDNGTNGWTIEGNVFYNIKDAAVMPNGGSYITVKNNIFIDVSTPFRYGHMFQNADWSAQWNAIKEKYDFSKMPYGTKYPEILKFFSEPQGVGGVALSNIFEKNLIYNPTEQLTPDDGIDDSQKDSLQIKDNWVSTEDPGFVDVKKGDFNLKDGAKVFSKIPDFKAIPFSDIGVQGDIGPVKK